MENRPPLFFRPGGPRSVQARSTSKQLVVRCSCRANAEFSSGRQPTSEENVRATGIPPASQRLATHRAHLLQRLVSVRNIANGGLEARPAIHDAWEGTAPTSARRVCSSPVESNPARATTVQPHLPSGPRFAHMDATVLDLSARSTVPTTPHGAQQSARSFPTSSSHMGRRDKDRDTLTQS